MKNDPWTKRMLARFKRAFGLKTQLLITFCAMATIPTLVVMILLLNISQQNLNLTVNNVTSLSEESLKTSSDQIAGSAMSTLTESSQQLIKLSAGAINKTSETLIGVSQKKLQDSSRQIIGLSQQSNEQLTRDMMNASTGANHKLSRQLIDLSSSANQQLARTTSGIAEKAVQNNTRQLVQMNDQLADELSDYLAKVNQQAAQDVSERLIKELEKEPLVNFRLLAQVIGQTFAGGHLTANGEAYLLDVDKRGRVLASTRYKRRANVASLEIVKRALQDPPSVAEQMPLITYRDGDASYIGVYVRKKKGGAFITSYQLAKAQSDLKALGSQVDTSLANLVKESSQGTRQAFATSTNRIQQAASDMTQSTIATIKSESDRLSEQAAVQMADRAAAISRTSSEEMTAQAERLANQSSALMKSDSQEIMTRALAEMGPIGKRSAQQAVSVMTPLAEDAVAKVKGQLGPQVYKARVEAANKMLPEAQSAMEESRRAIVLVGSFVLVLSTLVGLIISFILSKRIADPVEVQKRIAQAELNRLGQEMEIATQIQTALIPASPDIRNYDLALQLITATEVGGDLIDYYDHPNQFWLIIGDVTGHGLTPGLVMMMSQTMVLTLVTDNPKASPAEVLAKVNRILYQNVQERMRDDNYMTLQLIRHNGDGKFTVAGMHCDIFIYRHQTKTVDRYEVPGMWTGMLPSVEGMNVDTEFELGPLDVLLIYTDGLIEAMNEADEQYDVERLEQALLKYGERSVEEIKENILAEVKAWMHKQGDDISIAVLKRHAIEAAVDVAQTGAIA